jgi:hypothetical protein
MDGPWIKIGGFLLLTLVCVWVMSVVLAPTIGKPSEDRRLRHPAGFSVVGPEGWPGTVYKVGGAVIAPVLRFAPEKTVGPVQEFTITRWGDKPQVPKHQSQRLVEFGGLEGTLYLYQNRGMFAQMLDVEIDGEWFRLSVLLPTLEDLPKSAWWAYFNSIRVERAAGVALPAIESAVPADQPAQVTQESR